MAHFSGSNTLSISSAIFLRGPGLADTRMSPFWILLELRLMEVVVTTGAQNPYFFTGQMPFLSPNQQCQSTERKRIQYCIAIVQQYHRFSFCQFRTIHLSDHSQLPGIVSSQPSIVNIGHHFLSY